MTQIGCFRTVTPVWPMAMKCCTKLETAKERCPIVFQGHPSNFKVTRDKTSPILTQIGRFQTIGRSQLSNPSDLPCLYGLCTEFNLTWKHLLGLLCECHEFIIPSICLNIHGHRWGCLNNPIFSNLGLCAACWAHFMCHHELLTSVSHPLSSLNSSLGFAGGKHNQKITIAVFRLVLQHFVIPGCFLIFLSSLSFLLTFFWLVCYCSLWLYFSPGN